jgi:hypothetical protein
MEKNVYQILQDWHELLKSGVISDDEFAAKKKELLDGEKTKKNSILNDNIRVLSYEEQRERDMEYDLLFNNKTWLQKNKSWLIGLVIATIVGILIWYFNKTSNSNNESNNIETKAIEKNSGYYTTNADNSNYIYFYKEANSNTRKTAHFVSRETVYIEKVENDFGYVEYTNERGQTSKGWLRMKELEPCPGCEKNVKHIKTLEEFLTGSWTLDKDATIDGYGYSLDMDKEDRIRKQMRQLNCSLVFGDNNNLKYILKHGLEESIEDLRYRITPDSTISIEFDTNGGAHQFVVTILKIKDDKMLVNWPEYYNPFLFGLDEKDISKCIFTKTD